ncbi:MAG TPA: hypothetical protein VFD99_02050 [Arthrobacter sp.]|nr:hypothetical protein [Arthrobacter sp.]
MESDDLFELSNRLFNGQLRCLTIHHLPLLHLSKVTAAARSCRLREIFFSAEE